LVLLQLADKASVLCYRLSDSAAYGRNVIRRRYARRARIIAGKRDAANKAARRTGGTHKEKAPPKRGFSRTGGS